MAHSEALDRARGSLDGLSVGDAFGERFFLHPDVVEGIIASRALPAPKCTYTDDSMMAMSIVSVLSRHGQIDQDVLAASFADRYEWDRGHGPAMHGLLARIRQGEPWHDAAPSLFEGQGSFGNGAAMRAAVLSANAGSIPDNLNLCCFEAPTHNL